MTAVRARLMGRLPGTFCALLLGGVALLGGCSASNNIHYGTAVVTLSDTNGDFDSYIVEVDAITLTRTDGLPAYALTSPQWVDLVKVHDLNELVDAPAIAEGTYTTLTLTLDYTAATVMVDVNGVPTAAKTVDATGNPASITSLT